MIERYRRNIPPSSLSMTNSGLPAFSSFEWNATAEANARLCPSNGAGTTGPATGTRQRHRRSHRHPWCSPPLLIGCDMLLSAPVEDANAIPAAIKPLSRCHALLFLRGNSLHVMDLGSTNGTWRGTERIPPYTALPVGEGNTWPLAHFG